MIEGRALAEVTRAVLDPRHPAADPLVKSIQLMLVGFGYNIYDAVNTARANDLIVRDTAAQFLAESDRVLAELERAYRRRFLPPPSREHPFHDPEDLAPLRALERLRVALAASATAIRSFEVPADDAVWAALRCEGKTIERLLEFDIGLIAWSRDIATAVEHLSVDDVRLGAYADVERTLAELDSARKARQTILTVGR